MSDQKQDPETLFHYTTQSGFLGIVKSREIWASKLHYLNDAVEMAHGLELARSVLDELREEAIEADRARIEILLDVIRSIEKVNICVVSFSEEDDLLSQWRAYGDTHGSYAIGFRRDSLDQIGGEYGFSLNRCEYEDTEQRRKVTNLIKSKLNEQFSTKTSEVDPDHPRVVKILNPAGDFGRRISQLAALLKHASFKEEREWRLVSRPIRHDHERYSFRLGRKVPVPYFKIPIKVDSDAIQRIVIGPSENFQLAADAVKSLLHSKGFRDVDVDRSKVPLRSW